jgi:hypothetical protein
VYVLDEPYRTRYLSQPGIALSCAAHGGLPYVMLRTDLRPELLDMRTFASIRGGDRIWIRFEDLGRFVREVLPRLDERVVLVTGDSDHQVPGDFPEVADQIVESGLVERWFTTNCDGAHREVISGMPIGLNHARKHELIGVLHPNGPIRVDRKPLAEQEREWDAVAAAAPPLCDRVPKVIADFYMRDSSHSRKYGESRTDIRQQLRDNRLVVWVNRRWPLPELLAVYAAHAFVLSPHGNALDCYRTWEALLMGCIPIVKRSVIDRLYDGLPVAIVDDWSEITPTNCDRWLASYGNAFDRAHLRRTLSSAYWMDRIHGAAVA